MQELEKILEEIEQRKARAEKLIVKPPQDKLDQVANDTAEAFIEAYKECQDIIRKHMNDGWIPVEEALPDEEAEEYIKKKLHGIGYLYPCLVTYRSPMTERIHVVRFYYDIYEHWFVDAGEEVCEKERCIAWRPLPEPYRPERSDNHDEDIL